MIPSILPSTGPIGVFDSGYGGLTILDKIRGLMPEYDYIYWETAHAVRTDRAL